MNTLHLYKVTNIEFYKVNYKNSPFCRLSLFLNMFNCLLYILLTVKVYQ